MTVRADLHRRGIREIDAIEVRSESGTFLCKVLREAGSLLPAGELARLRETADSMPPDWQALLAAYEALRRTRVEIGSTRCKRLLYRYQPTLKRRGLLVLHYVDPASADIVDTRIILDPETGSRDLSRSGVRLDNGILSAAVADFNRTKTDPATDLRRQARQPYTQEVT